MIPAIAIAAYSGTGKTTLIKRLLPALRSRGLRVAVVKHDGHRFDIDHEGKDSWRFTQAGAQVCVISSAEKTALIEQRSLSLPQVLSLVLDVDLILVEGYKNEDLPQIGLCRRAAGKGFTSPLDRYLAVVTDLEGLDAAIPLFKPDDIEELTEFIMKNMEDFTHFNDQGRARMVDVGSKDVTRCTAVAAGRVLVSRETYRLIESGGMKKGDVLTVAQIVGIMGTKRTPDLICVTPPAWTALI